MKNHNVLKKENQAITGKIVKLSSETPYEFPDGLHPVYCDDWLMGGVYNKKIIGTDDMSSLLKHTEIYNCYNQSGKVGMGVLNLKTNCITSTSGKNTNVDVAVCGNWNAVPRKAVVNNITPI